MLRLGQACVCPVTGVHGFVSRFIGEQPIGRAADGTYFKAKSAAGRRRQCLVRVLDDGEVLTDWMAAERLTGGKFLILVHPVFAGAEVEASTVEVQDA